MGIKTTEHADLDRGYTEKKTMARPVTCPKGHQIYVMYFPDVGLYGFGCGTCKIFSTSIENAGNLLTILVKHGGTIGTGQ